MNYDTVKFNDLNLDTKILIYNTFYKKLGVTMILSIVPGLFGFHGLGHLYLEKLKSGIIFFIQSVVFTIIGWTLIFAGIFGISYNIIGICVLVYTYFIYAWHIKDAIKLCKKYNNTILDRGEPPW